VERRRVVAQRCIQAITDADELPAGEREAFIQDKMAEVERDYA
jgi:hypothetical protein